MTANTNTRVNSKTAGSLDPQTVVPAAVSLIRRHSHFSNQRELPRLSTDARSKLTAHDWTGGMDELDRCVLQALVLRNCDVIQAQDIRLQTTSVRHTQSLLIKSLRNAQGVRSVAAKNLGISARTLREQLAVLRAQGVRVPMSSPASVEQSHD